EDVRAQAEERGIELRFESDCDETIDAPAALAITALRNLLSNAIGFSPQDAPVTLNCSSSASGYCSWIVKDQGPGVEPQHLRELTDRFVHLQPGGTGLGLAISDTIARRFG